MSRAKNLVLIGNAVAILETIFVGLLIFNVQVPENYIDSYVARSGFSALMGLFTPLVLVLCLAGQVINWLGFVRIDTVSRSRWRAWFLVSGILTFFVNPISGVLFIVAFSVANRDFEVNKGLASIPELNDWTVASAIDDLDEWGVLSPTETEAVRNELQL